MKKIVKRVEDKLRELYEIYEIYIWKADNRKLIVIMADRSIAFYLYNKKEVIDEFIISFDEKEDILYQCLCLKTLGVLFGNVQISNDENRYYSNGYKNYIELTINDEELNNVVKSLVGNQEKEYIDNNRLVNDISKKANRKVYKKEFIKKLDKRIKLSKNILEGD